MILPATQKARKKILNIGFDREIFNPDYLKYFLNHARYLVFYGGAGSGKSYFAAQKILIRMLKERNHRFLFVRKVGRTIRNSQFQLMQDLINMYGLSHLFLVLETHLEIICKVTGSKIICAGLDDVEKLKSIQRITGIWVEEATEIKGSDFEQLDLRLRGLMPFYKQIILTFNPISEGNYFVKRFVFGRDKRASVMHSVYQNNKFDDGEYGEILEDLKERDENLYLIYAKGIPGIIKNLVLKPFIMVDDFAGLHPDRSWFGLDFGFNNPSALIKGHTHDIYNIYAEELIYQSRLTNNQLIDKMKEVINPIDIALSLPIYADSAEPARIEEICQAGFNCSGANKDVMPGLNFLKQCKIYSLKSNDNLNKERESYKYKEDKDGNVSDKEVVKFKDHAMDGLRYGAYTDYLYHKTGDIVETW